MKSNFFFILAFIFSCAEVSPGATGQVTNLLPQQIRFAVTWYSGPLHMMDRKNGWTQTVAWTQNGSAVFRTTDGGKSWRRVLTAAIRDEQLNSYFHDARTAWVARISGDDPTNVTVCSTTNGGTSWGQAKFNQDPAYANKYVGYCFFSFAGLDHGWLMLVPDHGMNSEPGDIYETENRGESWRCVNSTEKSEYGLDGRDDSDGTSPGFGDRHPYIICGGDIEFQNATNGWLLGGLTTTTRPFLFFTHDGGLNWQEEFFPVPPSLHDGTMIAWELPHFFGWEGIISAKFTPNDRDSTNSYTVFYHTRDGGQSWQRTTPTRLDGLWSFISARKGWLWSPKAYSSNLTFPGKGTLCYTSNGGNTWRPVKVKKSLDSYLARGGNIAQLEFVDARTGWAVTWEKDDKTRLLQTTDGGKTWNAIRAGISP
jgi:photosystem II stability/assembly factor-like uncharacterized protein